jgi:hypothetical protein
MKLYAAFDEYGGIMPTTIRRSEEDAFRALSIEPNMSSDPLSNGVCIGSFESRLVSPSSVTWLRGWRFAK